MNELATHRGRDVSRRRHLGPCRSTNHHQSVKVATRQRPLRSGASGKRRQMFRLERRDHGESVPVLMQELVLAAVAVGSGSA